GAPHGPRPPRDLRREVLRGPAARARPGGPPANDVEDGAFPHQAEDEGDAGAARRRDERPHVLRGRLVRLRRRALCRGTPAPLRGGAGRTAVPALRGPPRNRLDARAARRLPGRPEVRHRGAGGTPLRRQVSRRDAGRRPHHLQRRMGSLARVQHAAGARASLRGDECGGARRLSGGGRRLAGRPERSRVREAGRRWALLIAVALLVVVLVGGRWAAFETAERVWAAGLPGGSAYLKARDFARLVSGLLLLATVAWGTSNLLFVYRSIGSMQLSRRLGDLEIVEAVPQPILLACTVASGLVFGFLLALGTGDWWMSAVIAAHGVGFGITDPVLHRDVGYYLGTLPWSERLRALALAAVSSATLLVGLLYAGIGSLRFRRWLPSANAHARAHLGLLLALLAATLTWDAVLDPAQSVAGLHGDLAGGALDARLTVAPVVAALGAAVIAASLVWGVREKPVLLLGAWGPLLEAELLGPGAKPAAAGLSVRSLAGGRATWVVAPGPDLDAIAHTQPPPDWTTLHRGAWARAGRPIAAVEDDTILQFEPLPTHDSVSWFGPAFREFAIAAPDTWPALRRT